MHQPDSTLYELEQINSSYPPGVENNYWNWARNRIIFQSLKNLDLKSSDFILDIGCGAGITVRFLNEKGYTCYGVEPSSNYAKVYNLKEVYWGKTFQELDDEIKEKVKCVMLLDVIEHVNSPTSFLGEIEKEFPNLQFIYLTAPARKEIWSNYDDFFGHFLRFDIQEVRKLEPSFQNFKLARYKYFFHSLYFAARIQLALQGKRGLETKAPKVMGLHALIGSFLIAESYCLPPLMPGSSMEMIFKRT